MIYAGSVIIVILYGIHDREVDMVNLELSEDEAKILESVLENYHSHLDVEIHRTYKREFRDALKEREKFLATVIERLRKQRAQVA